MVYSADGIPIAETLAAQKRLAALLSYKLKREYVWLCECKYFTSNIEV